MDFTTMPGTAPTRTPSTRMQRLGTTTVRAAAIAAALAVTVSTLQDAPAASAASAAASAASYGPDGTHYPSDTPEIRSGGSRFTVVDVAASGPAIRRALDALTPSRIAAGAVIRVAPGHIADLSALNGYTNNGRVKVLITARDGFQSVTGGSWALRNVTGITLMRFDVDEVDVKGATHSSFAWLRVAENWVGLAASAGLPVRDVELIEVVEPDSALKNGDSAQIKAYAPDVLSDVLVEGGYIAPSYYVDAQYGGATPRPHTDSLQIEGDGITGQVTVRDTVVFSSNNSAVIIGGVRNVAFEEALVVGGDVAARRYPFLRGGAGYPGATNGKGSLSAIQGSGGGNVDASGSTFIGSLQPTWDSVSSTRTDLPGKVARSGGFAVDAGLSTMTAAQLDTMSTRPTTASLTRIWDDVTTSGTPSPAATASATASPTAPGAPVADTTAPKVAITSPRAGAVLSGTTTVTVTATDDTAVTGVSFYLGSDKIGEAARTGSATWSMTTGTAGLRGTVLLTARATDAAGNTTTSAPVTAVLR
ncbi:Ig-like domain-containing protein [Rathayibacter sp. VKM Ac-2857]|uniref:Ig-like domain-containing protein n=1 Tax=Rathayibacter sp. VKM Ac-2857 TaxID=2739020 RepID=UPI001567B967|nr:Ig-like domain-containing protein [Rathayibacter sp. VKM Ac-2857]NQX18343.1 hypothetical protein [Rathayibacter sp. VKM Ac-2857]